jgi:hypothetical protein
MASFTSKGERKPRLFFNRKKETMGNSQERGLTVELGVCECVDVVEVGEHGRDQVLHGARALGPGAKREHDESEKPLFFQM